LAFTISFSCGACAGNPGGSTLEREREIEREGESSREFKRERETGRERERERGSQQMATHKMDKQYKNTTKDLHFEITGTITCSICCYIPYSIIR
jgi:hypothetical protein